jgi:hypothetical protein
MRRYPPVTSVSVAGQISTYVFNCVRDGELVVIQPMGMR